MTIRFGTLIRTLKMLENFQRQISSKLLKILLAENIPEVGFLVDKGFASLELRNRINQEQDPHHVEEDAHSCGYNKLVGCCCDRRMHWGLLHPTSN